MSQSRAERPIAVILASIDEPATCRGNLESWLRELDGHGEVIVVDASSDGTADLIAAGFPQVRLLRRPPGRLAPELWRDGIEATSAPVVALSTTRMFPDPGWCRAMLARQGATGAAVVGGPIRPADCHPLGKAIYLLRYVNYLLPLIEPERIEPPGDNAVYRRDRLVELESLWERGFWEVEIHEALRARGDRVIMADDGVVNYSGEGRFLPLLGQRFAHARHYGASRARGLGVAARLARIVLAPLVPAVLLGRIVSRVRARGHSLGPWLPALPYLLPLLVAWSLGEARGIGLGFPRARRSNAVTSSPTNPFRKVCETHQS